jgi:RND family efflux transporter MFP subunit
MVRLPVFLAASMSLVALSAVHAQTQPARPGGQQARTVPVLMASAVQKAMPVRFDTIGVVQPVSSVVLRSRVESQVMDVLVADGATVKEGDVIIKLDQRTVEAQIKQAEAQLARSQAQLEQAQRDVRRFEQLMANDAGSRVNLDNSRTQMVTLQAQIQSDQAALENLKVQLGFYTIRAPISGRIGVVGVKPGNIAKIAENSTPFATLIQISPIYVAFAVPQKLLVELRSAMADGTASVTATPQGTTKSATGKIAVIDNSVDNASGTITLRAMFENDNELLWPGALCNVRVTLRTEANAIVVPREAVQTGQAGNFVFVVQDGIAKVRPVTLDRALEGEAIISSGLKAGENVVTDGQLLLTDGARVEQKGGTSAPAAGQPAKGAS